MESNTSTSKTGYMYGIPKTRPLASFRIKKKPTTHLRVLVGVHDDRRSMPDGSPAEVGEVVLD